MTTTIQRIEVEALADAHMIEETGWVRAMSAAAPTADQDLYLRGVDAGMRTMIAMLVKRGVIPNYRPA